MADTLNILVLGHGDMGSVHVESALAARQAGAPLEVSVVERDTGKRDAAHAKIVSSGGRAYESLGKALDAFERRRRPVDIVIMALNDNQHFGALTQLKQRAPGLKALFSEKPLTETVAQSQIIEPWLRPKFVTLNTVINLSPVFREMDALARPGGLLHGATPIGFEAVWEKDRTKNARPTIGIRSDIIHPLGVMERLGQGGVAFLGGSARRGALSAGVSDVIYALPETEWQTDEGLPIRLRADYAAPAQQRSVTAWYRRGGDYLAAQMDFDLKQNGRTVDLLSIAEMSLNGEARQTHGYMGADKDINHGIAMAGDKRGKAQAFFGRSLQAFLGAQAAIPSDLSTLADGLRLQRAIEAIDAGNPKLAVTVQPASEHLAQLRDPGSPAAADPNRVIGRFPTDCSFENLAQRIFWMEQRHSRLNLRRPSTGSAYLYG